MTIRALGRPASNLPRERLHALTRAIEALTRMI